MIHHVTQRCALIRICREVSRAVAIDIAMDKNAVAKFCSQGLVCVSDLCIRPLKPVDCLLRLPSVRMVSSPCAHQWPLLDGVALLWQFHVCVIIQALVHGCATMYIGCTYPCFSRVLLC